MQKHSQKLQETFYTEIPITYHLGITVADYNGSCLTLKTPLEKNINHKHTAFAGSLNILVTLAGWGLLWLILQEQEIEATIVIQDSRISYLKPVTKDFSASCNKPSHRQISQFLKSLKNKGKARIELCSKIWEAEELAVEFQGRYVALLDNYGELTRRSVTKVRLTHSPLSL
ncbi:MAG: thioesterase domain-containing protein [Chlorogloeopsis fritschii C42_A2020_084]|uniref:thioesterase domain-containing protein n=1 Tax=Chlorogloeopsis fritschii TaxID=1124 RepID=UPI001A007A49|nr:thioesterase domain-containing protein [Chlorogloeopsis fritschii]MBF2006563.1 thioesterase domain-containing protein [Chlorogloeopsis fritschii C42_A2020_084]